MRGGLRLIPPNTFIACAWDNFIFNLPLASYNFPSVASSSLCLFLCTLLCHAVAQLVQALRYKPEGRGFDSRECYWNFSLRRSFRPHFGPGVDSASNRIEYHEYILGVKAAGAKG